MLRRLLRYTAITIAAFLLVGVLMRICITDRFIVRGESMYPTLRDGQDVWANKLPLGGRIYTSFDFSQPKLKCFRLPGLGRIQPDDLVIFNDPDPFGDGHISFKINRVYIKRCIASPGDTLCIRDGYYLRNGLRTGSIPAQRALSETPDSILTAKDVFLPAFPYLPGWSIKDMGPVYVPRKGDTVAIDSISAAIYARALEYETGIPQAQIADSLTAYTFKHDYYFFGGDLVDNSRDSRYFGIVPDDFVIGLVHPRRNYDRPYRNGIKRTLMEAGSNRSELEYVLDYYRKHPDFFRAAEFLIAGMSEQYEEKADGARRYDAITMTADELISHIQESFASLHSRPWNRLLPEEDFFRLILPYRVSHEPLTQWREQFRRQFAPALDTLPPGTGLTEAVNALDRALRKNPFILDYDHPHRNARPDTLLASRRGDCQAECAFMLYVFRSLGIPATIDRYKVGNIHSWNVIRDTTGHFEIYQSGYFNGNGMMPGGVDGRTKGKVIREQWPLMTGEDVTASYFGQNTILLSAPVIGIYSRAGIIPLTTGERILWRYRYKNLEPGKVYFPLVRTSDGYKNAGYPFLLSSDGRRMMSLRPGRHSYEDITVERKVRMYGRLYAIMQSNTGTVLEGSDTPFFQEAETLAVFESPAVPWNDSPLAPQKPYRYYRVSTPYGHKMELAEIHLFTDSQKLYPVTLTALSGTHGIYGKPSYLFDGDVLSYFESDAQQPTVIFDAGRAVLPRLLEWIPRNDDNFIRPGDDYELLYHNGPSGWCSAGSCTASAFNLTFQHVPAGALYILKDRTRGREEEVFIIESGKQLFL